MINELSYVRIVVEKKTEKIATEATVAFVGTITKAAYLNNLKTIYLRLMDVPILFQKQVTQVSDTHTN